MSWLMGKGEHFHKKWGLSSWFNRIWCQISWLNHVESCWIPVTSDRPNESHCQMCQLNLKPCKHSKKGTWDTWRHVTHSSPKSIDSLIIIRSSIFPSESTCSRGAYILHFLKHTNIIWNVLLHIYIFTYKSHEVLPLSTQCTTNILHFVIIFPYDFHGQSSQRYWEVMKYIYIYTTLFNIPKDLGRYLFYIPMSHPWWLNHGLSRGYP